ncbi:MAG: hypothetical protein EHM40_08890 [Chloroflexi bacterium]|nr:MAG: hypothetical protein EHM40_08890 [Chloroflexota bacterium]
MINVAQLKKISEKPWFYPVALLLIGFITYCYVLTSLGYYWADWEIVMFMKLNPALQFDFYAHDRPFPWTYQLIYALVGSNPIGWHVVALLIRWAGTLLFVQSLTLLWPRYKNHLLWLGVLLLVYPGFLQQSQSATKARHFMTFLLFALSVYLMALAIKRPRWARLFFPLSWLATFAHLFTTEYFAGLELMRPVLLWMLIGGDDKKVLLRRVVINSLPYFLILIFYFWARLIYFPVIFQTMSRVREINSVLGGFQENPVGSLLVFLNRALFDLIYLTVQTWVNGIINFEGFTFENRAAWLAFGLGILLAAVFAFFHNTNENETAGSSSPASVFIIGFLAFILGALPIWVINEQISAGAWNDRFALTPMLGACLMVLALLLWLVRPAGQKFILSVLLAFSIAAQVWVVNVYRRDWRTQLDYYWQLHWRAPALKTGTALLSFEQPSPSVTHYSDAGFALNVLYHYQTEDGLLPYWYFIRRFHFHYVPDDPIAYELRTLQFRGNTSQAIAVLHQTGGACLRVLDTVYASDPLYIDGQDILIPLSNLSQIVPDPSARPPDPDIFGPEPERTWCYYFQKADLARQQQDWDAVINLYKQAQQKGFTPGYGAEYIPLIEAYAQTGNWQKAYDLTLAAEGVNSGLKKMLCANWSRLSEIPSADPGVIEQARQSLSCSDD